jgi:hypothetical protein
MSLLASKIFIIFLLLNFGAGTQAADIYDILTKDGHQQRREGTQYVVGLYRERPKHALTKDVNILPMKNKFGAEFTCMVPRSENIDQNNGEIWQTEAQSETGRVGTATTVEQVDTEEEGVLEWPTVYKPVVKDKLSWFLQNYDGPCLKWDGGFWKTLVCFNPVPHIIQQHDKTTFDLGKLNGVFDPKNSEHRRIKPVAEASSTSKEPFLQLVFTGGTDGRVSLVNILCTRINDRVRKLVEPIELVYVLELSSKAACNYDDNSPAQEIDKGESEVLDAASGSADEILADTFSKIASKGLDNKPCVYYKPGWFTFEICWQKHVQQYHLEHELVHDKPNTMIQKVSQKFNLGFWDGQPLNLVKGSTPEKSIAKAVYIGGTECDLTGKPRKTTVHFKCNKHSKGT